MDTECSADPGKTSIECWITMLAKQEHTENNKSITSIILPLPSSLRPRISLWTLGLGELVDPGCLLIIAQCEQPLQMLILFFLLFLERPIFHGLRAAC